MTQTKKYFKNIDFSFTKEGKVQKNSQNLELLKEGLHSHSSCLCLAKFTQVTMHLGSGLVHSCHHPQAHKIPLSEIEKNPAALFNTKHLQHARTQMLEGTRPKECDYCWRIEDNYENSDRFYKSLEDWAIDSYDDIVNSSGSEIFCPKYLEVSFGNACNMQCSYCGPEFSSKWVEELKEKGPLKVIDLNEHEQWVQGWQDLDNINIPNREYNPYIEAFWKWFPEIYPSLQHFRITGGEPILNKNTIKALDYVFKNPRQDLEVSINSNLSVTDSVWTKFINKIKELEQEADFKKLTVFISLESWQDKAAYARTGIEFDKLQSRVYQLLNETSVSCTFMATYNVFAVTSFNQVLNWVLDLKKSYNYNQYYYDILIEKNKNLKNSPKNFRRVGIDVPYLRHPEFLDTQYCTNELVEEYIDPCLDLMNQNISNNQDYYTAHLGFEPAEVFRFKRIVNHIKNFNLDNKENDKVIHNRAKFYDFVNQLDIRKNTKFLQIFPEMTDYYELCKESKKIISQKIRI